MRVKIILAAIINLAMSSCSGFAKPEVENNKAYKSSNPINIQYSEEENKSGMKYFNDGNYLLAKEKFISAVKINDENAIAWDNLGSIFGRLGDLDSSIQCYSRAFKLKPNSIQYVNNLGVSLYKKRHFDLAIEVFSRGIELDSSLAQLHYYRGMSFKELGRFEAFCIDMRVACKAGIEQSCLLINKYCKVIDK
jgi:Tfp pilus assembly protein PilF